MPIEVKGLQAYQQRNVLSLLDGFLVPLISSKRQYIQGFPGV
jgi:hypothetical protein